MAGRDIGRSAAQLGLSLAGYIVGAQLGGVLAGMTGITQIPGFMATAGYMLGSIVGSSLFPPKQGDMAMPPMARYPIQHSDKGNPVPVTYGTVRLAGNVLWAGDSHPYTWTGVIEHMEVSQTRYRRSFLLGLCEGVRYIRYAWDGKDVLHSNQYVGFTGEDNEALPVLIQVCEQFTGENWIGSAMLGSLNFSDWIASVILRWKQRKEQSLIDIVSNLTDTGIRGLQPDRWQYYEHLCCAFFSEYDLGVTDEISNFTFEIGQEPLNAGLAIGGVNSGMGTSATTTGLILDHNYEVAANLDPSPDTGLGRGVDIDGERQRIAVGVIPAGSGGNPIAVYDYDGVREDLDFGDGGLGWSGTTGIYMVRFSPSGQYLYALEWRSSSPHRLWKYDARTGEVLWYKDCYATAYPMAVDAQGNVYYYGEGFETQDYVGLHKISPQGVRLAYYDTIDQSYFDNDTNVTVSLTDCYDMIYDTVKDRIMASGAMAGSPPYHNVVWIDCSTGNVYAQLCYLWIATDARSIISHNDAYYVAALNRSSPIGRLIQVGQDVLGKITQSKPGWPFQPRRLFPARSHLVGCTIEKHIYPDGDKHVHFYNAELGYDNGYDIETGDYPSVDLDDANWADVKPLQYVTASADDSNPADVIEDLLTNERYGAGFPAARIDSTSFSQCKTHFANEGYLISLNMDRRRPLLDWLDEICAHCNGFIYWIGGVLYLGAWRQEAETFAVTRDRMVVIGDQPPVRVRQRKYSERHNRIELTYLNRADDYAPAVAMAQDNVDQRISGKTLTLDMELRGLASESVATVLAHRYLVDNMYRVCIYNFTLGPKDMLLTVGAVGTINDGDKITDRRIRVTSISEAKDGMHFEIEAVDDLAYLYPDIDVSTQTTGNTPETVTLLNSTATLFEDEHEALVHFAIAPQNAYCSGWEVYVSYDEGENYELVAMPGVSATGTVSGGSANSTGQLLTSLANAVAPTHRYDESLTVDIGTVTDLYTDISEQEFWRNEWLAMIGDEIVAYKTAGETGTPGQWTVTQLIRGLYGTQPAAHAVGEDFATLNVNCSFPYSDDDIGRTVRFRILTVYDGQKQSLGDADIYDIEYTIQGSCRRPSGAGLVRLAADEIDGGFDRYSGASFTVYWNLSAKNSGFNRGPQDGGDTWVWGDSTADLTKQNGVAYGSYVEDPALTAVDLVFKDAAGTFVSERSIAVTESATVTKATDLGGNNPAEVEVWPRRLLRALRAESTEVDDGT